MYLSDNNTTSPESNNWGWIQLVWFPCKVQASCNDRALDPQQQELKIQIINIVCEVSDASENIEKGRAKLCTPVILTYSNTLHHTILLHSSHVAMLFHWAFIYNYIYCNEHQPVHYYYSFYHFSLLQSFL